MPTVQQILDDVKNVRYPPASVFTNAQLLNFGNEILRKIWQWMDNQEIYSFNIIANQPTYTLPTNGQTLEKITVIEIATDSTQEEWNEYYFNGLLGSTDADYYFYDAYNGTFGISPIPTTSITNGGRIFYGKKFTLMSDGDLTATPAVNEDYHSLIVNYICMKAAESGNNPDVVMRNNFAQSYNDDWDRLMFDWTRKKCKLPLKKRSNRWWR